jgi:ATP-dependent DNA helicase RecQ
VRGGWLATGTPWAYDAERYDRVAAGRAAEQQAMRGYATTQGCRMEYLRRQLDDSDAAPCGRCDSCTGQPRSAEVSLETLAAAQATLSKPGVEVEPRRIWPTGLSRVKGKIPTALQAETGRALGRLSDIGWGGRLRELFAGPDAEIEEAVVRVVVQVLATWGWTERPAGIVLVPSRSRPRLVSSLAARLAALGRLPLLGELERLRDTPPASGRSNSAQRLRAVHGAFAVTAGMALDGAPVLLVDDRTDTGWTLTECARVLREAGAGPVLPLVLAIDA